MASAPNSATPVGAPASVPCHPSPCPAANAITTTALNASTFALVATFWTHRPDVTPVMLMATRSATAATPTHLLTPCGQPASRPMNSPVTTPSAAIAAGYIANPSHQPTTNPMRRPNASRAYTYLPPALGWRVASSAKHSAPANASTPPSNQATNVSQGRPSCRATNPGVRKIPEPIMMSTTMASPSNRRSDCLSIFGSVMRPYGALETRSAPAWNPDHFLGI